MNVSLSLEQRIERMCEPEAAEMLAAFGRRWGDGRVEMFFSDLKRTARQMLTCVDVEPADDYELALWLQCPEAKKIKEEMEILSVILHELANFPAVMDEERELWRTPSNLHGQAERIVAQAAKDTVGVLIENCNSRGTYWNFFSQCREVGTRELFKLLLPNNCTAKFVFLPDYNRVQLLFFSAPASRHGAAIANLRDFRTAFEIMTAPDNVVAVESPVLAGAGANEAQSRISPRANGEDWRFVTDAEETTRLYRFWVAAGGIDLGEEEKPDHNLVFYQFEEAVKVKEELVRRGFENPYANLLRSSIYNANQAAALRNCS
jgi:hypothetical protein